MPYEMNSMTEHTTTTINTDLIPKNVGRIEQTPQGSHLTIKSMRSLRAWVNDQIPDLHLGEHTIIIKGSMSNCIALQIGIWVAGRGLIVYQSKNGMTREMV